MTKARKKLVVPSSKPRNHLVAFVMQKHVIRHKDTDPRRQTRREMKAHLNKELKKIVQW